jgi:hypothetical protein
VASDDGGHAQNGAPGLRSVIQRAVAQFTELSGANAEQVCGVRSTENGWSLLVEVVDLERIPSTTSVMSTYRVDADSEGELLGYERIRRYNRAATDPR